MSMLEGVSQCWWLSSTCAVNWDAWSAIGTLLAVVVALGLGIRTYWGDRTTAARRHRVATLMAKALARRLFDQAEALGNSPGVTHGIWDQAVVDFMLGRAQATIAHCEDVHRLLLDLDDASMSALADVVAEMRGIAEEVETLRTRDPQAQVAIAPFITRHVYDTAHAVVATEASVMKALGGEPAITRVQLHRQVAPFGQ